MVPSLTSHTLSIPSFWVHDVSPFVSQFYLFLLATSPLSDSCKQGKLRVQNRPLHVPGLQGAAAKRI